MADRATRQLVQALRRWPTPPATWLARLEAQVWERQARVRERTPQGMVSYPLVAWALAHGRRAWLEPLLAARFSVDGRVQEGDGRPSNQGRTLWDFVTEEADALALLRAGLAWHVPNGSLRREGSVHVVVAHGWLEALGWLLRKGAMVDLRNATGETPLHVVFRSRGTPLIQTQMAGLLLAHGADVHAKDHAGRTALDIALIDRPHLGAIRRLLMAGATPVAVGTWADALSVLEAHYRACPHDDLRLLMLRVHGAIDPVQRPAWVGNTLSLPALS